MSYIEIIIQAILVFIKIFLPLFGCVSVFYFIWQWLFIKNPYSNGKILCAKTKNTLHINFIELKKTIDFDKFAVVIIDDANSQNDELAVKIIDKKDILELLIP